MKKITVNISNDSDSAILISELNRKISESTRNTSEFESQFKNVEVCIDDFCQKAKNLARSGTAIHAYKEFIFQNTSVFVVIDYPPKNSFLMKLKKLFKRNKS